MRERKHAGGVMITSSHNPPEWNGVKYKASYGGSGKPPSSRPSRATSNQPLPTGPIPAPITEVTSPATTSAAIEQFVDLQRHQGLRVQAS